MTTSITYNSNINDNIFLSGSAPCFTNDCNISKSKKIAVVMININNYEYYREFNELPNKNKLDWFYFTDTERTSNFWNIKNINKISLFKNLDNRLKSKYIKMNTHKLLPNYDYYLHLDGSFPITNLNFVNDIFNLIPNNLVLFLHNSRRKERNIKGEVSRCSKLKSVDKEKLNLQFNKYLEDKYPDKKGNLYSTGIIFKKNEIKINQLMELWFQHNKLYTTRDQISLPYVLWKSNVLPSKIIRENINLNTLVGKKKMKSRKNR